MKLANLPVHPPLLALTFLHLPSYRSDAIWELWDHHQVLRNWLTLWSINHSACGFFLIFVLTITMFSLLHYTCHGWFTFASSRPWSTREIVYLCVGWGWVSITCQLRCLHYGSRSSLVTVLMLSSSSQFEKSTLQCNPRVRNSISPIQITSVCIDIALLLKRVVI